LRAAEPLLDGLRGHPDVIRCSAAGSLRRVKEVIGDIICWQSSKIAGGGNWGVLSRSRTSSKSPPGVNQGKRHSGRWHSNAIARGERQGISVWRLRISPAAKEHNIVMRQRAILRGLRLNEYGLFKSKEETRAQSCLWPCGTKRKFFCETGFAVCAA